VIRSNAAGAATGSGSGCGGAGRLDSAVRMALLLVAYSLLVHVRLTLTRRRDPCNIVDDRQEIFSAKAHGKKSAIPGKIA
jgi:hypothetical protein